MQRDMDLARDILKEQPFADLLVAFGAAGDQFRQETAALMAAFSFHSQARLDTLSKAASAMAKRQVQIERVCMRFAGLGWTLPMRIDVREFFQVAEQNSTDEELEEYMLDFYTSGSGQFFRDLRRDALRNPDLVGWQTLLEQCFDAYDRGHYQLLIPALLIVVEGAVTQKAGKLKDRDIKLVAFAKDIEKATRAGGVRSLAWRSTRIVVGKLFAFSHFDGPPPLGMNRHWLLHGRDHTQWTQTDALRLFNLVDTIQ